MACSKMMDQFDEPRERFILIVKPEQSGKTFIMIKQINKFIKDDISQDRITINFIFCDNSLLLTKQTTTRLQDDLNIEYLPDINEPYVEFSSRNDGIAKKTWQDVRTAIEDGCRNVICCTNGKRVVDIKSIISRINRHNSLSYNFNIWLDEADKFDSYIKKEFIPLLELHRNVSIYMLTATPQPIFQNYNEVRTMAIENTTTPSYHGWNDCRILIRDDETNTTLGFARQIADEMLEKNQLIPGIKGYVPANYEKKEHHKMRNLFLIKGVAVFLVNGDGIELSLPRDKRSASEENNDYFRVNIIKENELHFHISQLYNEYNVDRWPCIITGNICVGRGISIQQPDFMLNFAILSNCSKKTEASQNAGRMKGNFKHWDGYAPPIVYTTKKFDKIAREYEEQSREIAQFAFEKDINQEGTAIVSNVEVKNILYAKNWELVCDDGLPFKQFDNLEDANSCLLQYNCRKKSEKSLKKNQDGFILSTTTKKLSILQYDDVKEEMESWTTLSTLDTRKGNKDVYSRMFIAYEDTSNIESVKYLVRIAIKKTK